MPNTFSHYSKYYDLLYEDKDYYKESEYIHNIIQEHTQSNKASILELGCGTGAHAKYLTKYGYEIFGIDKSEIMISMALSIDNFECIEGDMCDFDLDKKFDNVVSLFHVMSYINSNNDLNKVFSNVSRHINKGGLFIFDVWYSPAVYSIKPSKKNKIFEDHEMKIERNAKPEVDYINNLVEVNYQITVTDKKNDQSFDINESHNMRHFSVNEISLFADIHGFELVVSEELITKLNLGKSTWGACFTLRKI